MARLKSTARSAAAKKAAKTRKPRTAAKKASTTRKRPGPAKKAAVKKAAAKKVAAPRKSVKPPAKISAPKVGALQSAAEIDQRIAIARRNLQELAEQAAGSSGGSTEELMADRIAAEEAKLEALRRQREKLPRGS